MTDHPVAPDRGDPLRPPAAGATPVPVVPFDGPAAVEVPPVGAGGGPLRLTATAVGAPGCALGESPRWAYDTWWWVDAEAGVLWAADAGLTSAGGAGAVRAVLRTGGRLSLVQPAQGERVVVASGTDLLVVDPRGGAPRPWSRLDLPAGWMVNDGTVDDAGRLWIGSVHPERRRGAGALHLVEADGRVRTVATGFTLSNGMLWRSSASAGAGERGTGTGSLLHVDSGERCLWQHEVAGTAIRSSRATRLPAGPTALALPDGVAGDQAGGVWVAMYGTGQVWRLLDGRVQAVVQVPTPQVTSVALGGPDGRDLLVTTAREGMDAAAVAADPNAGRLFRARVDVSGASLPLLLFHNLGC